MLHKRERLVFQAKDIQRIGGFPKHRYEFLARKFPIPADIESGDGQGTVASYSFSALMDFAIGHQMKRIGLSSAATRKHLDSLRTADRAELMVGWKRLNLFDATKKTPEDATIYIIFHTLKRDDPRVPRLDPLALIFDRGDYVEIECFYREQPGEADLAGSDGFIRINVGLIKARVLERIQT